MIELLGIIASLFIIAAFCCNNTKYIRLLDSVGALLYIIYGFLISSISVVILNCILLLLQIYKLYKGGIKNENNRKNTNSTKFINKSN